MLSINPFVDAQEAHRGKIEASRENAARHADSFVMLTTHGIGEVQNTTVVPFDCTFIEMPNIAYCFSLDGDTLIDGKFPTSTGAVWKWQQDARGYYLGAYVFFVVTGDPSYDLTHSFTFSGIALKDLPEHLLELA